jgi:asparagine synthase (glutamine-hydrolysing)
MCGIAGVWFDDPASEQAERLKGRFRKALNSIGHRGPDYTGVFESGNVVLGHVRLSIIDLDSRSHQPMKGPNDSRLVFNGEIYNFRQIRGLFPGYEFQTESDTEVLLAHRVGKRELNELNGFFAFANVSESGDQIELVRDRMGIKPLYYVRKPGYFAFASELGALIHLMDDADKQIHMDSLMWYLQLGYIPAPATILRDVQKVMPGERIVCHHGKISVETYYKPEVRSNADSRQFAEFLEDSVRLRLISDVPVGCFLSGGMDSSVIALLAARHTTRLKTFSVGFPELKFLDEAPAAEETACHIGTEHTTIPLELSQMESMVPEYARSLSEPFADSSGIAVYALSAQVKKHVTVALSGDGADELLGGYNKHAAWLRLQQPGVLGGSIIRSRRLWQLIPRSREGAMANKARQLLRFSEAGSEIGVHRYMYLASMQYRNAVRSAITGISGMVNPELLFPEGMRFQSVEDMLLADQRLVLPNDMLFKVDHASMQHALEVRVPFLDFRVVETANALPVSQKITPHGRKMILREIYRNELPEGVFSRRKQGFEVPLLRWMRGGLGEQMEEFVFSEESPLKALISSEYRRSLKRKLHGSAPDNSAQQVWALYVLSVWMKTYGISHA